MVKGLFAGLTGLDITYYQNEFPNENLKSKTNEYQTFVGGPAANAAITYAILGGNATLVTCLGNSTIAKAIKLELSQDYQVNVIDVRRRNERFAKRIQCVSQYGKSNPHYLEWTATIFDSEGIEYEAFISDADFCLSDCNLPEVTVELLKKCRKHQKKIVLDSGSWKPHFPVCLPLADEIIASVNCKPQQGDLLSYLEDTAVKNIAITDGENDTQWFEKSKQGTIKIPKVQAVDTLAAGDVLHGAYCYYRYHEGLTFVTALERASEVASESVKYIGPRHGVYHIAKQNKK